MSQDKTYFPKDDELNLFSVVSSKDGLVIPLGYWGYPGVHLTIYTKDMKHKKGFKKINLHLTSENNKIKYFEKNYELPEEVFNLRNKKFEEELTKIVKNFFNKHLIKIDKPLVCVECFVLEKFPASKKLDKKESALEYYKNFIQKGKKIEKLELSEIKPCEDNKHCMNYEPSEEKFYIKYPGGFVTYEDNDLLIKSIESLLRENFKPLFTEFKILIKLIKSHLKRIK
jgi:hypothetical protein